MTCEIEFLYSQFDIDMIVHVCVLVYVCACVCVCVCGVCVCVCVWCVWCVCGVCVCVCVRVCVVCVGVRWQLQQTLTVRTPLAGGCMAAVGMHPQRLTQVGTDTCNVTVVLFLSAGKLGWCNMMTEQQIALGSSPACKRNCFSGHSASHSQPCNFDRTDIFISRCARFMSVSCHVVKEGVCEIYECDWTGHCAEIE